MPHPVTCYYCRKKFDRDKEEYVEIPNIKRRYAHKTCFENPNANLTPERKDEIQLEEYVKHLFKSEYVPPNVKKQINEYVSQYKFTYSSIYKTLFYYFDILHRPNTYVSNPTIAIVPYVYPKAKEYYYKLYLAEQANKGKTIEKPKEVSVTISAPDREPMRKRNLFTFLDEEEGADEQ